MEPTPLTRSLPAPGPFWTFNREERNAVAILFGLLTGPGNVEAFARLLDWQPADLPEVEVCVEWTYLRDLWSHHSRTASPDTLRAAILDAGFHIVSKAGLEPNCEPRHAPHGHPRRPPAR